MDLHKCKAWLDTGGSYLFFLNHHHILWWFSKVVNFGRFFGCYQGSFERLIYKSRNRHRNIHLLGRCYKANIEKFYKPIWSTQSGRENIEHLWKHLKFLRRTQQMLKMFSGPVSNILKERFFFFMVIIELFRDFFFFPCFYSL